MQSFQAIKIRAIILTLEKLTALFQSDGYLYYIAKVAKSKHFKFFIAIS
jgi:hypothetical protein